MAAAFAGIAPIVLILPALCRFASDLINFPAVLALYFK
jgi:hypothetical protein